MHDVHIHVVMVLCGMVWPQTMTNGETIAEVAGLISTTSVFAKLHVS